MRELNAMNPHCIAPPIWLLAPSLIFGLSVASTVAAQPPTISGLELEISASPPPDRTASLSSELQRALASKNYERAERLLADAIARQPTSRQLLTRIARVFTMDRKPLNAAIALKKAEALGALDNQERLQLALAYIAMKRGDWARSELDRLVAAEPANVIHRYWLARLDYDAGQYDSAIRRLKEVAAEEPTFARAHDNLGLCYEALNQPDEAIRHYREAVQLNRMAGNTPSPWPPLNLGILLRSRGELEDAERLFRESLTYDRQFTPGLYQLGAVLETRDRLAEAVKALREATASDPTAPEAYYALSRIYRRQGQTADADRAMHTFQRLHQARREQTR
jgi:tetratricopeptide (TPR) repeat protein